MKPKFGRRGLRRSSFIALVAFAFVFAAGCAGPVVQSGSQESKTERRDLGRFESMLVANAIHVHVRVGAAQALSVTAAPDVVSHVLTVVANGRLSIGMDGTTTGIRSVKIELSVPSLSDIEATTSADVTAEGFSGQSLRLAVASSATLAASGSTADLQVVGASSARLLLAHLLGRAVRVDIGTSAQVELTASDEVSGSVHESGSLRILGNPKRVEVTENTSGRVTREN